MVYDTGYGGGRTRYIIYHRHIFNTGEGVRGAKAYAMLFDIRGMGAQARARHGLGCAATAFCASGLTIRGWGRI